MTLLTDPDAPKKAVNLRLNGDLVEQAKALGINLSKTLEQHLTEVVCEAQREKWLAENGAALDSYGDYIERNGTFSDGLRRF